MLKQCDGCLWLDLRGFPGEPVRAHSGCPAKSRQSTHALMQKASACRVGQSEQQQSCCSVWIHEVLNSGLCRALPALLGLRPCLAVLQQVPPAISVQCCTMLPSSGYWR